MLQRFDVVLVPFPFVEGDNVKARPAIILAVDQPLAQQLGGMSRRDFTHHQGVKAQLTHLGSG
jgi:hypothetical protein